MLVIRRCRCALHSHNISRPVSECRHMCKGGTRDIICTQLSMLFFVQTSAVCAFARLRTVHNKVSPSQGSSKGGKDGREGKGSQQRRAP